MAEHHPAPSRPLRQNPPVHRQPDVLIKLHVHPRINPQRRPRRHRRVRRHPIRRPRQRPPHLANRSATTRPRRQRPDVRPTPVRIHLRRIRIPRVDTRAPRRQSVVVRPDPRKLRIHTQIPRPRPNRRPSRVRVKRHTIRQRRRRTRVLTRPVVDLHRLLPMENRTRRVHHHHAVLRRRPTRTRRLPLRPERRRRNVRVRSRRSHRIPPRCQRRIMFLSHQRALHQRRRPRRPGTPVLERHTLVAVNDLRPQQRQVVVQQADPLVPSLPQNAVLHIHRPTQTIQHVVTAPRKHRPPEIHRPPAPVVHIKTILVVRHVRIALPIHRQALLNVRILHQHRTPVLHLRPRNAPRHQTPPHRETARPRRVQRLPRRIP